MAKPVLIDFFAEWCGPCKMQHPIIEKLKKEFGKQVEFKMVDIDENPKMASEYGVMAVPTLKLLDGDGEELNSFVGLTQEAALRSALQAAASSE